MLAKSQLICELIKYLIHYDEYICTIHMNYWTGFHIFKLRIDNNQPFFYLIKHVFTEYIEQMISRESNNNELNLDEFILRNEKIKKPGQTNDVIFQEAQLVVHYYQCKRKKKWCEGPHAFKNKIDSVHSLLNSNLGNCGAAR